MIVSNMLKKYMSAEPKDMYDIVGALMGYINADPYFKTNDFIQAVHYVLDNGVKKSELFQEFDDSIDYEEDESKWDEEYYSYARVYLKDNFCEKRIRHVKSVAKKIYSNSLNEQDSKGTSSSETEKAEKLERKKAQDHQEQKMIIQKNADIKNRKLMIFAVIILMVVIASIIMKVL